jgi:hypothetical protein
LIPDMIAGRDDRHAAAKEVNGDLPGYSATSRSILAVHDNEIYPSLLEKEGHKPHDSVASGLTNNVAQKENANHLSFLSKFSLRTV